MMNEELSQLLKLKKQETPGEEYFDAFLPEFHRYQRAEILSEPPAWQRVLENATEVFFIPRPVVVAVTACATLAIVAAVGQIQPSSDTYSSTPMLVQADQVVETPKPFKNVHFFTENYSDPLLQQPEIQNVSLAERDLSSPRYVTGEVLGPYETTLSF